MATFFKIKIDSADLTQFSFVFIAVSGGDEVTAFKWCM